MSVVRLAHGMVLLPLCTVELVVAAGSVRLNNEVILDCSEIQQGFLLNVAL